jgi:cytochrome c peroxidase
MASLAAVANSADLPLKDQPHLRRPVAAAWIEKDKLLAVANRCGSISVVDVRNREVLDEIVVGKRLADLVTDPKGRWLAAVDEWKHELIVLQREKASLRVVARHRVSLYPVSIAVSPAGSRLTVASLWSRKITIFASSAIKTAPSPLKELAVASLEFNPRRQSFQESGDGKYVIVHDAFAKRSAIVDTHRLGGGVKYPAGLELPDSLDLKRPTAVSYGGPSRVLDRRKVVDGIEVYRNDGRVWSLGHAPLPLGPAPELIPADRGEELFYNGKFSASGWMSCHYCHVNGHTTYQLADTLGDDTTGTPKRIPTLLGTRLTDPWAWSGQMRDLNEQVRKSLDTTMHVKDFTEQQVANITAYLHTLPPPPPLEPATADPADRAKLERGKSLFAELGCAKCHVPPLTYTSSDAYDVGLRDEKGMTKFNPPSLRGVSQGYSFLHDGRAKKLEEVFTVHGHGIDRALTDEELADLLRFLRSL